MSEVQNDAPTTKVNVALDKGIDSMVNFVAKTLMMTPETCIELALIDPPKWQSLVLKAIEIQAMEENGELRSNACRIAFHLARSQKEQPEQEITDQTRRKFRIPVFDPAGIIERKTHGLFEDPLFKFAARIRENAEEREENVEK